MDVVVLCNGLGNQMSQYAFFLEKKRISPDTVCIFDRRSTDHNRFELGKLFGIRYSDNYFLYVLFRLTLSKKSKALSGLMKLLNVRVFEEPEDYDFDPSFMAKRKGINFFYGGWHSEKYFAQSKDEVHSLYRFPKSTDGAYENMLEKINNKNSVSLHIRRGDFVNKENYNKFGAVTNKKYFDSAIAEMAKKVADPHFFIFSDDPVWAKDNYNSDQFTIVDFNKKETSWRDMELMSHCKHNINSNSSFSWWGAWLNKNPEKIVIVPYYFISNVFSKDIYPEGWHRMDPAKYS